MVIRNLHSPTFGYACGAVRVSTDPRSESIGPRAHVVGFLDGARALGITPRVYLAGDEAPQRVSGEGSDSTMRGSRAKRVAIDSARLALRKGIALRASRVVGPVDVLYERQATFQDLGRGFQRRGSKWVVESNGPFWYEASSERSSLGLVGVARRLEIAAYRDADLVVAVSEALREIIVRESGRRPDDVLVLPNATDAVRFDPAKADARRLAEGPVVGFAGYLSEWAGLAELLSATATLARAGKVMHVVIVGDGPHRDVLERQVRDERLEAAVTFTGHVPWDDVPSLMAGFDIAFSGQRRMSIGAMYHSPQKLYEYQAMGLPIVASDYPDARKLVESSRSGWLFEAENQTSLVTSLSAALAAPDRDLRGSRGRQALLSEHTWEVRVRALMAELERRGFPTPPVHPL